MTATESRLDTSAVSGTADATGRCVARTGPIRAWERWRIEIIGVSNTSSSTQEPRLDIYLGTEAPSNLINGTYSGNRDTDPNANVWLETGQNIIAVWSGGTPGSIGTLSLKGTRFNGV